MKGQDTFTSGDYSDGMRVRGLIANLKLEVSPGKAEGHFGKRSSLDQPRKQNVVPADHESELKPSI